MAARWVRHINRWLQQVNAFTDRWLPLLILLACLAGLLRPSLWSRTARVGVYLLAYNMFAASLGVELRSLHGVLRRPLLLPGTYLLLFAGLPAVGWALGRWTLASEPELAAGLVVLASMPVGAMAVVWSALEGGNTALSLALLGATTLTCGLVTPAVLAVALRRLVPVDPVSLSASLATTALLPALAGLVAGNLRRSWWEGARPYLTLGLRLTMVAIVAGSAAQLRQQPSLWWGSTLWVAVAVVALQILLGFLLGYAASWLAFSGRPADRLSMMFVTAMRNNGAGVILAASYLSPKVAVPSVLALLIQQPLAGAVARLIKMKRAKEWALPAAPARGEGGEDAPL